MCSYDTRQASLHPPFPSFSSPFGGALPFFEAFQGLFPSNPGRSGSSLLVLFTNSTRLSQALDEGIFSLELSSMSRNLSRSASSLLSCCCSCAMFLSVFKEKIPSSKACESLVEFVNKTSKDDPLLPGFEGNNPWIASKKGSAPPNGEEKKRKGWMQRVLPVVVTIPLYSFL